MWCRRTAAVVAARVVAAAAVAAGGVAVRLIAVCVLAPHMPPLVMLGGVSWCVYSCSSGILRKVKPAVRGSVAGRKRTSAAWRRL